MKLRRAVLLCGLAMMLAWTGACARSPSPGDLTTGRRLSIDDPRALEVMASYHDRTQHSRALRGSARVALEGADFKLNRPQRIALERPRKLRFEVLGLFDVLAAMLVSDGHEFGFYESETGEITRGVMTPELLWDLVRLDLEAGEVVDLLLGAPVPTPTFALAGFWLEADDGITAAFTPAETAGLVDCEEGRPPRVEGGPEGTVCSSFGFGRGAEIFRFDAQGLLRELRAIDPGRETRFSASFEDYAEPAASDSVALFPMQITVHSPRVGATARFEWKRIMLTDELPDRLFTIPRNIGAGG